jgi:CPA1 family monovalent cation:H+ antiporter
LTTADGRPFPQRDLILLLTFWVIIITLVGQGLTLPPLLRWLGLGKVAKSEQEQECGAEIAARRRAIDAVNQRLDQLAQERGLPEQLVESIRSHHQARLKRAEAAEGDEEARSLVEIRDEIEGLLIDAERRHIFGQLERGELIDEARRRIELELDLREAALNRNTPGALNDDG